MNKFTFKKIRPFQDTPEKLGYKKGDFCIFMDIDLNIFVDSVSEKQNKSLSFPGQAAYVAYNTLVEIV